VRICAYVVSDPSSNEETLFRILQGIATGKPVPLTLRSVDLPVPEEKQVAFGVRQLNVDDQLGLRHFNGVFYEGADKMLINLIIPPWDEETTVKISSFPDISSS
jgi:hypothetical protein